MSRQDLGDLIALSEPLHAIGVDIPIGSTASGQREADRLARSFVGARRSSVFAAPPSEVYGLDRYEFANELLADAGRPKLSRQSWALLPKIRQADAVAREDERVIEVHPEVCFREMEGRTCRRRSRGRAWPSGVGCSWTTASSCRTISVTPVGSRWTTCSMRQPWPGPPGGSPMARHGRCPTHPSSASATDKWPSGTEPSLSGSVAAPAAAIASRPRRSGVRRRPASSTPARRSRAQAGTAARNHRHPVMTQRSSRVEIVRTGAQI